MPTIDEHGLSELLEKDVNLRFIEPHIYSVLPNREKSNFFDKMARFYDIVICNPLYNRLIWGYSVKNYTTLIQSALTAKDGLVLDVGCGSLAFSAETYIKCERPIVFLDYSLNLLRIAKSRMIKLNGHVPDNMIFLQGDALQLPFKLKSFNTIISLNLLHVLDDINKALTGINKVLSEKGMVSFTTLIKNNRPADKYLEKMLKKASGVSPRTIDQLHSIFNELGISCKYDINGNMAFVYSSEKQITNGS